MTEPMANQAVPVPIGSPPWIMKPEITRWKVVPSYSGVEVFSPVRGSVHSFSPVARPTKFSTVLGAWSGKRTRLMSPWLVCSVTFMASSCHGGPTCPGRPGATSIRGGGCAGCGTVQDG